MICLIVITASPTSSNCLLLPTLQEFGPKICSTWTARPHFSVQTTPSKSLQLQGNLSDQHTRSSLNTFSSQVTHLPYAPPRRWSWLTKSSAYHSYTELQKHANHPQSPQQDYVWTCRVLPMNQWNITLKDPCFHYLSNQFSLSQRQRHKPSPAWRCLPNRFRSSPPSLHRHRDERWGQPQKRLRWLNLQKSSRNSMKKVLLCFTSDVILCLPILVPKHGIYCFDPF